MNFSEYIEWFANRPVMDLSTVELWALVVTACMEAFYAVKVASKVASKVVEAIKRQLDAREARRRDEIASKQSEVTLRKVRKAINEDPRRSFNHSNQPPPKPNPPGTTRRKGDYLVERKE